MISAGSTTISFVVFFFFPPIINIYFKILFLRDKNEKTEFDFDKDKYDIRIPEDLDETGKRGYKKQERMDQIVPESDYSLRVCITFLKINLLAYFGSWRVCVCFSIIYYTTEVLVGVEKKCQNLNVRAICQH